MWPYPWTHVGTPSHLGHMDRVAATMPSEAHVEAAQEAPDIGQWEGEDVPLVRPSSCNVKGGIPSSRRYLPTYLEVALALGSWDLRPSWRLVFFFFFFFLPPGFSGSSGSSSSEAEADVIDGGSSSEGSPPRSLEP